MALAIATNNAALRAAASASSVNRDMETSMARLSSGKRINSASDDAAGVAISSRLTANIRGTDQAIRNALDGQALIDTAEGAHKEIENILQRMREVSVQAANDTNNQQDRDNLQAEMDAMSTEIDRIAATTKWAGAKMLDTDGSTFNFHIGAGVSNQDHIDVNIEAMTSSALGLGGGTSSSGSSSGSGDFIATGANLLNDPDGSSGMYWTFANDTFSVSGEWNAPMGGSAYFAIGESIDDVTMLNISVSSVTSATDVVTLFYDDATTKLAGTNHGVTRVSDTSIKFFKIDSESSNSSSSRTVNNAISGQGTNSIMAVPAQSGASGIDLVIGSVTVTGIDISNGDATAGAALITSAINDGNGSPGSGDGTAVHGVTATDALDGAGNINLSFTGGATAGDVAAYVSGSGSSSSTSHTHSPTLDSPSNAMTAITAIDTAIETVNIQRSKLGAVSNRLSHTVNNLTNISANLSAARGGIEDADFAKETTNLAKNQILQQASTAMLAQANASKQNVLSLLQG